ncbi:hypothetical protein tf_02 [Pseudomonas phage tf]|jgi:hypothetical protein|uniref:Uncharacterized protein n=1 Tax=Pseudomonas phage tf TaxID=1114179 RepID=I2FLM4_9CAUD|nr:hypothetical protein tf_02 [Pseudomonas phage tf]CCE60758.1 hypothetical protein tf_02 [Pseudomonas phage tf]
MQKNEILGRIKTIQTRGMGLDKLIQETALGVIAHIEQHPEVSLAIKLYNAMPKGSRANALVAWLCQFGKVQVNPDKKTSREFPLLINKNATTDIAGGTAKPWFECKKPKGTLAEQWDFESWLDGVKRQLKKQVDAGNVQPDDRVAALLVMETKSDKKAA